MLFNYVKLSQHKNSSLMDQTAFPEAENDRNIWNMHIRTAVYTQETYF